MNERDAYSVKIGFSVRTIDGCRDLGCYSATLGPFCVGCARTLNPRPVKVRQYLSADGTRLEETYDHDSGVFPSWTQIEIADDNTRTLTGYATGRPAMDSWRMER